MVIWNCKNLDTMVVVALVEVVQLLVEVVQLLVVRRERELKELLAEVMVAVMLMMLME
jgi:hypothetical protein